MKKLVLSVLSMAMVFTTVNLAASQPISSLHTSTAIWPTVPVQTDIVVVGAGGAGMAAALQAHQLGAENIVILEQMPMVGGNTLLATGRMSASPTRYQQEQHPDEEDDTDVFFQDVLTGGGYLSIPELVRVMVDNSVEALDWLNDNFDTDIRDVGLGGGATNRRAHGAVGPGGSITPIGQTLVPALSRGVDEAGIPVLLNTEVVEILVDSRGAVSGVVAVRGDRTFTINATAVILATGGFGANQDMVAYWDPGLAGADTNNHVGATGTGILMAEAIGAGLVHMEQIQIHPTGHPSRTLFTEAMRGEGAILVNTSGERFVNELGTRDHVSAHILDQDGSFAYMVFGERVRSRIGGVQGHINAGLVTIAYSTYELAVELDMDPDVLIATLERYNHYGAQDLEPDFNRPLPFPVDGERIYAVHVVPLIHYTMGGVTINIEAEVLDVNGDVMPGFFAAGEVVGGIHGNNRLGSNSMTNLIVYGRIAANNAVTFVENTTGLTEAVDLSGIIGQEVQPIPPAAGEAVAEGGLTDGVFVGTARGYGGDISVRVIVEGGLIVEVYMFDHNETPVIYSMAEAIVTSAIISTQSTDVDTVSGATQTSQAIIEAVNEALGQ